jgi:hypothetical protein
MVSKGKAPYTMYTMLFVSLGQLVEEGVLGAV